MQSVHVSGGRNRPLGALVNGLMGLGIGAAAGAVAGAAFHKESDCSSFICFNTSRSQDTTFAALVFGPLGAVAGSMYGAVRGRERWEPVALR